MIQERLQEYSIQSKQEEENTFKEICQEIALAGRFALIYSKKPLPRVLRRRK